MFLCQPWKELTTPGSDISLSTNPQTIVSPATLDSLPLIQISGVGAVSINIGSYSFTLSGIESGVPVLVDCDAMTVTNVNQSVSYLHNMVGQFPRLVPGNNLVDMERHGVKRHDPPEVQVAMITIYDKNETNFGGNGIGVLWPDKCEVTEEANGQYEIDMVHPMTDDLRYMLIRGRPDHSACRCRNDTPHAAGLSNTVTYSVISGASLYARTRMREARRWNCWRRVRPSR